MDSYTVEAGNETLLRQAPMTAETYLDHAIEGINARFGAGYAKAHPELVAAFMQTCALDLGAAVIARALDNIGLEGIARALDVLTHVFDKMGPALDGIADAIDH